MNWTQMEQCVGNKLSQISRERVHDQRQLLLENDHNKKTMYKQKSVQNKQADFEKIRCRFRCFTAKILDNDYYSI